jgi:hypothetical protein
MLLLRATRNLINPKHLHPILLWWLHLSIIRLAYLPDIIHIKREVRSRRIILGKENPMLCHVIGRVGITKCPVIGPKIVLFVRRIQKKTIGKCVKDMFNTPRWNPFLRVKLLQLVYS